MTLLISFEGGDGSGKSTQTEALGRRLEDEGVPWLAVREPGTTSLGTYLRDWLKRERSDGDDMTATAELFLFEAARAELVEKVIQPALGSGKVVIADRYVDSSIAYQGYGRGLPTKVVTQANKIATNGLVPDVTFLLDCPPEQGLARVGAESGDAQSTARSRNDAPGTRRFEQESVEFHARVRKGYLEIAASEPDRWHVVDGTKPQEEISSAVWAVVQARLFEETNTDS